MSDGSVERRSWSECRVEADSSLRKLNGMAIVFNALSVDLGGFREIIDPAAVDRALNEASDVRALVDHDTGKVLGRTRAGTLTLRKESRGLRAIIEPDTEISYVKDLMRSVARGDVSGMSFGFRVLEDEWNYDAKVPVRTVTDMKLSEVSIVSFPAYEQTDVNVALRSLAAFEAQNPRRSKAYYDAKLRMLR
jgi:HK97 family phage prohead protease